MMSDNDIPSPNEFQDPLENYEPRSYEDAVEEALAEQSVNAIMHEPYASIASDTIVSDAVRKLSEYQIALLMVETDGKLTGVFSHRDVLNRVADAFGLEDPHYHPLSPPP